MTRKTRDAARPARRRLALLVCAALSGTCVAAPSVDTLRGAAITFERNEGQFGAGVLFMSRGAAGDVSITRDAIAFSPRTRRGTVSPLRVRFAGAGSDPVVEAEQPEATRSHHYVGHRRGLHRENVPHYGRVSLKGLYRDVDLAVYGRQGVLEYDFVVAPGADPGQVRLDLSAADHAWIDAEGNLRMRRGEDEFTQHAPVAYQQDGERRVPVAARFEILAGEAGPEASFVIGAYDAKKTLVIDPVMAFSTYFAGVGEDWGPAMKADAQGNLYVAYNTYDTAAAQYVTTVAKFDSLTQQVVYSTTVGPGFVNGLAIGASGSGHAVAVTGSTASSAFPHCFAGTDCADHGGGTDAFVTLLNAGGTIAYSRLLGGSGNDEGLAITMGPTGAMHVAGSTDGIIPTTLPSLYPSRPGGVGNRDAFVAKLDVPAGLVYSTYLGSSGDDHARAIALDAAGNIHVAGSTRSPGFPTFNALQDTFGGGFVMKMNATGTALHYSTFLGGSGDNVRAIAIDPVTGEAIVAGDTGLPSFPQTGVQRPFGGTVDAFVTRLSPSGAAIQSSVLIGGSGHDIPHALAVRRSGEVFVAGYTQSSDLPTVQPVQAFGGGADAFLAQIKGDVLAFSTHLGGNNTELGTGVATDGHGGVYVAGHTLSANFPTTPGAYRRNIIDFSDAFLTRIFFPESAVDLNVDGNSDLVFQNADGRIAAWTMNGTAASATANLIGAGQGWTVTHAADLTGDGRADILFKHANGRVHVYTMNGLTVTGGKELLGAGQGWSVSHVADLNGDNRSDLILSHEDGRSHAWLMDGLTVIGSAGLQGAGSPWQVTHTGDFNGDGKADIVWRHTDGRGYIYLMNGTSVLGGAEILAAATGWIVSHVADLNGDGKSDLVFRHTDGRAHAFLMSGTTFGTGGALLGAASGWTVSHVGDMNGDGKADVVFRNTDGRAHVRLMNGVATVAGTDVLPPASGWSITQLLDLNGDGRKDLVFRNVNGSITVRLMNGLATLSSANLVGPGGWSVAPPQ